MKKLLTGLVLLLSIQCYAGEFSEGLEAHSNNQVNLTVGQIATLMDSAKNSNFDDVNLDDIFSDKEQEIILNIVDLKKRRQLQQAQQKQQMYTNRE